MRHDSNQLVRFETKAYLVRVPRWRRRFAIAWIWAFEKAGVFPTLLNMTFRTEHWGKDDLAEYLKSLPSEED